MRSLEMPMPTKTSFSSPPRLIYDNAIISAGCCQPASGDEGPRLLGKVKRSSPDVGQKTVSLASVGCVFVSKHREHVALLVANPDAQDEDADNQCKQEGEWRGV